MSVKTILCCPISNERTTIETPDSEVPEVVESADLDGFPVGWGILSLTLRVPNPDYDETIAIHQQAAAGIEVRIGQIVQEAQANGHGDVDQTSLDRARRELQAEVDARYPLPDPDVVIQYSFQPLSPAALSRVREVLGGIGFSFLPPQLGGLE